MWRNAGETGVDSDGKDKVTNGIDDDVNGYVDDMWWTVTVTDGPRPYQKQRCAKLSRDRLRRSDWIGRKQCFGTAGVCWSVSVMAIRVYPFDPKTEWNVVRGSDEATATTVDYATSDSTALAGRDYTKTAGSLTFAAGEKRKVSAIPIINDAIKEGDKTFRLTLSNPLAPSALGKMKSAMITIKDNDPGISLGQSSYSFSEDAGAALVTIVRGSDAETPAFTVNYASVDATALAGADYTGISGALNFEAGETSKSAHPNSQQWNEAGC